jgi:hypothetical protein
LENRIEFDLATTSSKRKGKEKDLLLKTLKFYGRNNFLENTKAENVEEQSAKL